MPLVLCAWESGAVVHGSTHAIVLGIHAQHAAHCRPGLLAGSHFLCICDPTNKVLILLCV